MGLWGVVRYNETSGSGPTMGLVPLSEQETPESVGSLSFPAKWRHSEKTRLARTLILDLQPASINVCHSIYASWSVVLCPGSPRGPTNLQRSGALITKSTALARPGRIRSQPPSLTSPWTPRPSHTDPHFPSNGTLPPYSAGTPPQLGSWRAPLPVWAPLWDASVRSHWPSLRPSTGRREAAEPRAPCSAWYTASAQRVSA